MTFLCSQSVIVNDLLLQPHNRQEFSTFHEEKHFVCPISESSLKVIQLIQEQLTQL